jgi:two-component system sensor histidine kinase ChiS
MKPAILRIPCLWQHLLVGLLCWWASDCAQALEMRFDRVLLDESLRDKGVGAIKTINQDALGFIWIGAEYGLVRYDGAQFVRYSADPNNERALSSNYINDLQLDLDGRMWVATDKGLHLYHPETDDFSAPLAGRDRWGNGRVAALAVDRHNNLLLARDDGVTALYSNGTLRHYPIQQLDMSNYVSVQTLFVDADDTLWLGTKGAGAAILTLETGEFRFFRRYRNNPATIISDNITTIAQDARGNLWFGSYNGGLSRLDPGATAFHNYVHDINRPGSITENAIWDIFTDSRGTTWIATDHGGLARYNPKKDGFDYVRHQAYNPYSLSSNQIRTLFEDRQGNLWIGLFPSGLNYFNRAGEQFFNYRHHPDNAKSLSHSAILSFYEDHQGVLWVGTEEGLNAFDRENGTFQRYTRDPQNPRALQANPILSLVEDREKNLWVGTWSGGVHRMDPVTREFKQYVFQEKNTSSLSNNIVWSLEMDHRQRLWLGTEGGGLNLYQPETDSFVHFKHNSTDPYSLRSDFIWTMMVDREGYLWIGTTAGVSRMDPDTLQFNNFDGVPGDPTSFQGERVRSLMQDRQGRVWIGTQDNGFYIFDPASGIFTHYGANTALPALYVTGFVEDQQGLVWASTTNGLVRIDPQDMSMTIFNKSHGLVGNNFNREANFIDAHGTVYFGCTEGISAFYPQNLRRDQINLPLVITQFRILNTPVRAGAKDSPLQQAIWLTRQITLDHSHNMFSFEFSALEFRRGIHQEYAYKMEGFDQDWIHIGAERSATFTNLNPGRYTFKVKTGVNGEWRPDIAQIQVQILPAPWKTKWAYTLYILAIAALVMLLANTKIKQVQLDSERKINRELKNLNNIKDSFLANTSHELRTPLNGIIGIADNLSDYFSQTDTYAAHHLHLIASSGRRLANLINDILDYSKLANRNLELYKKPIDMHAVTEMVFALLGPLTANKSIQLINEFTPTSPLLFADENRLQQILINLVGNGIKYSNSGSVRVGMTCNNGIAEVHVIDTGIGIALDQQDKIFEAFSQIQNSNVREYGGTGLGLAITWQLVEQHGGSIWVKSRPNQGARFVFTLPLAENQDRSALQKADMAGSGHHPISSVPAHPTRKLDKPRNAEDQTILIVDDDAVNRMVLTGMLKLHDYSVIEAEDGMKAVEAIRNHPHIDLVIMDVMMPHMSGHEACRLIRQTHSFDSLPILFLTAKKNVDEDIQECFAAGGNDYLTKPVSKHDLLPRVANHLRIAGIIRKFRAERGQDPPSR